MERVRARDAGAFERLYDEYHRLVYGLAMRVLADPAGAEDVTQVGVPQALERAPNSFAAATSPAGWPALRATAPWTCCAAVPCARRATCPKRFPPTMRSKTAPWPDSTANSSATALAQLPDEQRSLIELGFFGGITQDQIARQTGLPLGTVKTRMRTGLRRLRNALEGAVTV